MERTWKPTVAGILSIVGGAMSIGRGVLALVLRILIPRADWEWWPEGGRTWGHGMPDILQFWHGTGIFSTLMIAAGAVFITFGVIALIGGIHAIKRRQWGLALAGSILAIPGSGPLGVLALIFVSLGKKEFR